VLSNPAAIANPFYFMAPESTRLPLVILATMATIIASQALITGVFSVVKQAVQLGFMPRVQIEHTSATAAGQIYVPVANWALMVAVILLVVIFQASTNLAAAYGLAVTGTMLITTCLVGILAHSVWKWPVWRTAIVIGLFGAVDVAYFAANVIKIPDGGWMPLVVGIVLFTLLTTWSRGRELMRERMAETAMPMDIFIKSTANSAARVSGTAVFMASAATGVPSAMLHNIKHNKILHERVIILTVQIQDMPYVDEVDRIVCKDLGEGFYRVKLRFGFLEQTDVPSTLARVDLCGPKFDMMHTSFFLSRQTLIASKMPGMAIWRENVFSWMLRNSASAMTFFKLPSNRVVELGSQVEI
jgi:KUP system potassium uptake protein